jgi:hypothetical protein
LRLTTAVACRCTLWLAVLPPSSLPQAAATTSRFCGRCVLVTVCACTTCARCVGLTGVAQLGPNGKFTAKELKAHSDSVAALDFRCECGRCASLLRFPCALTSSVVVHRGVSAWTAPCWQPAGWTGKSMFGATRPGVQACSGCFVCTTDFAAPSPSERTGTRARARCFAAWRAQAVAWNGCAGTLVEACCWLDARTLRHGCGILPTARACRSAAAACRAQAAVQFCGSKLSSHCVGRVLRRSLLVTVAQCAAVHSRLTVDPCALLLRMAGTRIDLVGKSAVLVPQS